MNRRWLASEKRKSVKASIGTIHYSSSDPSLRPTREMGIPVATTDIPGTNKKMVAVSDTSGGHFAYEGKKLESITPVYGLQHYYDEAIRTGQHEQGWGEWVSVGVVSTLLPPSGPDFDLKFADGSKRRILSEGPSTAGMLGQAGLGYGLYQGAVRSGLRGVAGELTSEAAEQVVPGGSLLSGKVTRFADAPAKSVPNPYGRLGSPAHQAKVGEVIQDIKSRGLRPRTEMRVQTVNGAKGTRYMDVAAIDPKTNKVVEVHQVGRTLKTDPNVPVARERAALRDVRHSPELRGAKRVYHGY